MSIDHPAELERYSRQMLCELIGVDGQRRLRTSRVTLIGCGALGSVIAETLVRAGVGSLRIADRDYLEINNLQRQTLFDEADLAADLPKAVAAAQKLERINREVTIDPHVCDVNHTNIERLLDGTDLILDGTDNFSTRYLLNDAAVKWEIPWVYGAVIGATGLVLPVMPGEGPCLRCIFEHAPPPEMSPTCDTAGVLAPAVNVVASLQATEALKLLSGHGEAVNRSLANIDVWAGRVSQLGVVKAKNVDCICCSRRQFEFLDGSAGSSVTGLCGRDAVQINPPGVTLRDLDFPRLAEKLASVATAPVQHNRFMLKATVGHFLLTVFRDGRAIIKGTQSADEALSLYAKYIGN